MFACFRDPHRFGLFYTLQFGTLDSLSFQLHLVSLVVYVYQVFQLSDSELHNFVSLNVWHQVLSGHSFCLKDLAFDIFVSQKITILLDEPTKPFHSFLFGDARPLTLIYQFLRRCSPCFGNACPV